MASTTLYRIVFQQQNEVWELYARELYQSDLWGFIEVGDFVFADHSKVVIDPAVDKLRHAYEGVQRSYIPMNTVLRIDEVEREGTPKATRSEGKIAPFPMPPGGPRRED